MKTCPTCGQELPGQRGGRICADCGRRMGIHDKWYVGTDSRIRHRDCHNPGIYPGQKQPFGEQNTVLPL